MQRLGQSVLKQGFYAGLRSVRPVRSFSTKQSITINWILKDGTRMQTTDEVGRNLMRTAHMHDIELEGACEGVCACRYAFLELILIFDIDMDNFMENFFLTL